MINSLNSIVVLIITILSAMSSAAAATLETYVVQSRSQPQGVMVEGVVEAIKSSSIAPQVAGNITVLPVKAGDAVKSGQLLARIDPRIASQQVLANDAQVAAARAQLSAARQEFERKRRLHDQQYISQAAFERAESAYKTAEAQTKAQLAQAGMAHVQTGLHTINAPYAGLVADVMVEQGDMAMPGQPLLTVYDPKAMRVVINVPQSQLSALAHEENVVVMIPAAVESERKLLGTQVTILPVADAVSNMVKVRVTLPQNLISIRPGMFARANLPIADKVVKGQIYVPERAVIRRSELSAVYVVDNKGRPQLRQVRPGRVSGEHVEIFSGLQAGERIAIDPIAAANYQ